MDRVCCRTTSAGGTGRLRLGLRHYAQGRGRSVCNDVHPRYGAVSDGAYTVAAVPAGDLKARYMRQLVDNPTGQPAGTVVVDPKNRFLYLVQEGGRALRYGVGVGKAGMAWSGTANVAMKREWPRWTPTKNMVGREPDKYAKWARGMEGGSQNPLGARALYLFKGFTAPTSHGRSARRCRPAAFA